MARGWEWLDEVEISEEEMDKRTPFLNSLAQQWSDLHDAAERRGWARQSDIEEGRDDREYEDDADEYAATQRERMRVKLHDAQVSAIEEEIHSQGARMMRPYEHWNEDERYMEYMETRYDYR